MQLTNFILPILSLASTLNASPILAPRAKVPAGVFTVTDFYDSGVPHSLYSYVSFNVQDPSFTAYCTASSSVMPTIATAPFPTRYNRDQTIDLGTIWVGTDVRTRVNPANPNGNVQYINYPTNFTVPYGHYTEPKKTK
ncbi:hypothetical protein TWF225_008120 [Orbilia oligospora]|nr:hypothetical protein TWF225_008120 [Orbilia oligospora]KAF3268827.1 hypothetical protein TWF217_010123 [Orbilia oligospora]